MDDSDQDFADLCSKLLKRVRKRPVEPKEPSRAEHQASSQASGDNRRRIHKKRGETGSVVTGTQSVSAGADQLVVSGAAGRDTGGAGPSVVPPAAPTAQSSMTAKDKILRRMQRFRRTSPVRMVPANHRVPSSQPQAQDCLTSSSSGLHLEDRDEALALQLQQELDREAAEAHSVDLEDEGLFFCQICHKDLSHMTPEGRTQHLNRCLDESEESGPAPPPPPPGVSDCPICGMKFRSQKSRSAHLKRCSSDMGVSSAVLLQALQRQAGETQNVPSANTLAQTGSTKRKGPSKPGLPARKKARKKTDPLDEDTMMALALSSSLLEQEKEQWCERKAERRLQSELTACYTSMTPGLKWRPDTGKGRGKKKAAQPRPPPLLLVQDAQAALMRLQERISALLLCSSAPSPPTPTRCPSSLPGWNGAAPLWQKSTLLDEGSTCAPDYYTPELREFIMPGKSAVGDAAFSNISNKPHSFQPVSEGPSCSQTAASSSPAPSTPGTRQLSVGSQALRDLMELAEDGMTLTQCGYAATGPDAERQSSAGASKNLHLSGFILEEAEEQTHLCLSGFLPETIHTHSKDTCSQVRRNHDHPGADKEQESNPSLLQVGLSKLVSDLSRMVNNPQLSDVQLQVDSGEVYFAHSLMVYVRCPLLAELVHESGFGVKEEGMPAAQRVLICDIPGQAVFALLQYLYTAHCSIPSSLQPHVLELASRFDLPELQRLCELHPEEAETHEHTSQEENNQTDQAFMELLRSMWNEEEEEDEEMGADGERDEERVLDKDQHGDDLTLGDREIREEKVNEEELEEIYEFAATQKKREEDRDSEEGKVNEEEDEDDVSTKLTEYKRGFSDKGLKLKSQPETKSSLDRSYRHLFSEEEEPSSLPSTSGLLKTHPSLLQKQQSTHKPSTEPSGRTLLQSSASEVDDFSLSPLTSTSKLPIPGLSPGQVGDWGGGGDKGTGAVKLKVPDECFPLKRESQGPCSISASLYPDSPPIKKEPELIVLSDSGEESEVVLSSSSPPPRSPSTVQNLQSYTKIKPQQVPKPDEPTFENKESSSLEFGPGDPVDFSPEVSWLIPSTPVHTGRSTTSSSTQTKSSMCRTQLFPKNGVSTSSVFSSPALSGNTLQTSKNPMAELERKVDCSSSLDHSLSPKRASSYYVNMDREDFALPLSQPNRSHHPTSRLLKGSSKQPRLYISTPLHTELHQPPFHLAASPLHTGPDRKKSMDGSRERKPLESPQKTELGSFHLSPLNSDPPSSCSHEGLQSSQRHSRCSIKSNSHNDTGTELKRRSGVKAIEHSNETGAADENCEDKEPGKGELEEATAESGEAEVADVSFQQSYMDEPPIAFNDSWGLNACVEANPGCFSLRLEDSGGSSQQEHSLGQRKTARSSSAAHSQTPPSRNYDKSFKSCEGVINSTLSPSLPDPTTHTAPAINSLLDSKIWDSWDEDEEEEARPLAQRVNPSAKLRTPDIILDPKTFGGVSNFTTFLLDHSTGRLFLGARDAILSIDTNGLDKPPHKITWDVPEEKRRSCVAKGKTEVDCHNYIRLLEFLGDGRVYVCGTYAFDPQCAFLELSSFTLEKAEDGGVKMETGKGKCPFEPSQHYTAVMAGGILYTAATSNFLGTLFDISRATGPEQDRIRTERSINWLSDPEFVSSAFIEQSADSNPTGDDDKIYFFFTEVAKEYDLYTKVKVPRVARVCKSDVGGMKTLQRRWTTFLKAQLVCEDKPSNQRYNILTDVFTMQHTQGDPSSTHFYGLFSSQWEHEELSAVCVFSLSDISKVLDGPFKELKKTCENWINPEPVPTPRPGQCLNSALKAEGFDTSLKLPDKVLTFVRDHPLMENSVTAAPLLVRKGIRYTKLAVNQRDSQVEPRGVVLHLGTDRGEFHQVEVVGQNTTLLQEIPLFSPQEPINNILLHKGQAVVGSPMSLARVQAKGCTLYLNCEVCARARGLGCMWNKQQGACQNSAAKADPGDMVDDASKCDVQERRCSPSIRELRVSVGLRLLLPCVQLSPRPCIWEHPPHRHTRQHHSDLEVTVTEESLGTYICTCQETGSGIRDPAPCRRAAYQLSLEGPTAGGTVAKAGGRHILAIYILFFCGGLVFGVLLLYFTTRRRSNNCKGNRLPDNSLSSEKGRDLLGSSTTPQSPSSASLMSEAFRLTDKRNGTTTTTTTLLSSQGNGGPHSNSYSGTTIHSNPSNGHGNALYANCNTGSGGLKFASDILAADLLDGRTGERERPKGGESELGEGDEVDEGLGDGLGEGIKGLEEDIASYPMFKSSAPLARCEESSI